MTHYTNTSHITSIAEVKSFFNHLVVERELHAFHPDDCFADYTDWSDGEPTFADSEIGIYERLMEESFDICERAGKDVYEMALDATNNYVQRILTAAH